MTAAMHEQLILLAHGNLIAFLEKAGQAAEAREAADWALAAKNASSTLHSLIGAAAAAGRSRV